MNDYIDLKHMSIQELFESKIKNFKSFVLCWTRIKKISEK